VTYAEGSCPGGYTPGEGPCGQVGCCNPGPFIPPQSVPGSPDPSPGGSDAPTARTAGARPTLVEFLNARYDETEDSAPHCHVIGPGSLACDAVPVSNFPDGPCTCGVPDQIRRRVTAARGIIRWATQAQMTAHEDGYNLDAMQPLRCLAVEFTAHPDHRPEWNPT
jgi:hypothetical protein